MGEDCCGGDEPSQDSFLFAKLAVTAFYDTKHAIYNTTFRAFGSDLRAGYKVVNGKEVFETEFTRKPIDNSIKGAVKEAVNTVADAISVMPGGNVEGKLLTETSKTQTSRAVKSVEGEISGYTRHGLNQAIGRDGGRGVKATEMLDAVKNPNKVVNQSNGGIRYEGSGAKVVVNADGKVISTFGKARGESIYTHGKGNSALNRAKEIGIEYDPKKIR